MSVIEFLIFGFVIGFAVGTPVFASWFRHRRRMDGIRQDFAREMGQLDAAFARQKLERQEQIATWDIES